jgi:hypothetical protein
MFWHTHRFGTEVAKPSNKQMRLFWRAIKKIYLTQTKT